jgi:hypothetical protein
LGGQHYTRRFGETLAVLVIFGSGMDEYSGVLIQAILRNSLMDINDPVLGGWGHCEVFLQTMGSGGEDGTCR